MLNGRLIFIFAPDGGGKTTHKALLTRYLREKDVKTSSVDLRSHANISYLLGRFFGIMGYPLDPWSKANPSIPGFANFQFLVKVTNRIGYHILLLLELVGYVLAELGNRFHLITHDVVVVEGGPLAVLSDLLYGFGKIPSIYTKFLLMCAQKGSYIFLDCDYLNILKRRGNKAEPRQFVRIQRSVIKKFGQISDFPVINSSSRNVIETQKIIRKFLSVEKYEQTFKPCKSTENSLEIFRERK